MSAPGATQDDVIGFGGAPVRPLETLQAIAQPGDIAFFGVNRDLARQFGVPNPGAADFVRENTACMLPWTRRFGRTCYDIGVLSGEDPAALMKEIAMLSGTLSRMAVHPALIACDHTASFANVLGTLVDGGHLTYVYFDAHFDFGMHSKRDSLDNGNFVKFLLGADKITEIVNIGGRSWSTFEPIYEEIPGFTFIPYHDTEQVTALLARLAGQPVYVSIDADVLDPATSPNVTSPEPFGMTPAQLLACCDWLGQSCQVIGADLCEVLPAPQSFKSEQALMRCLHALFPRLPEPEPIY
jgi:arginase family enzyme